MAPASRLWFRNCAPSVALMRSLDSSSIGNGSEPNFRIVTRLFASAAGKPPMPPAVIWTLPPGMASLIRGAEMTVPSRMMAKYSPTCLRGEVGEAVRAVVLEHEVDRQAAALVLADRGGRDLVAAEQRRRLGRGRGPGPRSRRSLPSGTKSRRPVWPTSWRTASGSVTPGSSTTTRSAPCVTHDGLGDAGRVHAALDDVLDDAMSAAVGDLPSTWSAPGTRRAGRPPGRGRASSRSAGSPSADVLSGSGEVREEVDDEGEDADQDDEDGAGSSHPAG